jgi:hypothetical protein
VNTTTKRQQLWFFWAAALACFLAIALFPVSNRLTRWSSLILAVGVWFGFLAMMWRRKRVRLTLLAITIVAVCLLAMPSRGRPDVLVLRQDYVTSLKRYEGVKFTWGGQNFSGMDSPGLVRRGLGEALLYRGVRTFRAGLIRYAIWLWWTECSPSDLGAGFLTIHQCDAPSLNALEHVRVRPGDLAVVVGGNQVLAYLGDQVWITADPNQRRVLAVTAPALQNEWFKRPVRIMRWRLLD